MIKMSELEFKLIPVKRIPISIKKKRIRTLKIDEQEKRYLQTEFPNVYEADYIQDIYNRLGDKKNGSKIHKKKTE